MVSKIPESVSCDVVISYHPATLDWICAAIDSVLNQQHAQCAIHVIADGVSQKDHEDLMRKFFESTTISFYRNERPIGPYRSLHKIFPHIKSDFIAIQDSDDLSLPHRIWHSVSTLKREGADIFGGAMENFIDWESRDSDAVREFYDFHGIIEHSGMVYDFCPSGNVLNPTMVCTRACFEDVNGFADWFCNADTEFIERAHRADKKIFVSDNVVVLRRLHKHSLCNNDEYGIRTKKRRKIMRECKKRFASFVPGFDPRQFGSLSAYAQENPRDQVRGRTKLSACLLSWKRQKNMQGIVDHLSKFDFIDDIVIWNNNPDIDLNQWVSGENVTIINSPQNKGPYGRYLCAKHAKHDFIYTQDDDCIVFSVSDMYRTFMSDSSRLVHGLRKWHYDNRQKDIHGTAHMAFVAWGGIFNRQWDSVFSQYIDRYGYDDILHSEADRIFSLLLNKQHNTLLAKVENLPGHSGPEAMWMRDSHWQKGHLAETRALTILGLAPKKVRTSDASDHKERFVIYCSPRTGSSSLIEALNIHPDICCYAELFHPTHMKCAQGLEPSGLMQSMNWRDEHPIEFIDYVWSQPVKKRVTGMKLFYNHNAHAVDHLVKDASVSKIILRRSNILRQYTSLLIARERQQWAIFNESERERCKVHVDYEALLKFTETMLWDYSATRKVLHETGQEFIEITYEELMGPVNAQVMSKLCHFLDVEPRGDLLPRRIKQNPEPLHELIANYDDLAHEVAGTAFEPMLAGDELDLSLDTVLAQSEPGPIGKSKE